MSAVHDWKKGDECYIVWYKTRVVRTRIMRVFKSTVHVDIYGYNQSLSPDKVYRTAEAAQAAVNPDLLREDLLRKRNGLAFAAETARRRHEQSARELEHALGELAKFDAEHPEVGA